VRNLMVSDDPERRRRPPRHVLTANPPERAARSIVRPRFRANTTRGQSIYLTTYADAQCVHPSRSETPRSRLRKFPPLPLFSSAWMRSLSDRAICLSAMGHTGNPMHRDVQDTDPRQQLPPFTPPGLAPQGSLWLRADLARRYFLTTISNSPSPSRATLGCSRGQMGMRWSRPWRSPSPPRNRKPTRGLINERATTRHFTPRQASDPGIGGWKIGSAAGDVCQILLPTGESDQFQSGTTAHVTKPAKAAEERLFVVRSSNRETRRRFP